MDLAQPSAPSRHRTVAASYLPDKPASTAAQAPSEGTIALTTTSSVLDYTDSNVGYRLTPDRLNWILREADAGFPARMYDMFENQLLADGHTRGLYEQRLDEQAVKWTWIAGDARPNSLRVAQEVDEATRNIGGNGTDLGAAIEFLAIAIFFGCSYIEVPWWKSRATGMQVPADFVCVPHRRFCFDYETFSPHLTSERNPWPGVQLVATDGSSWIRAESKRYRKQTQAGVLRTVAWWTLFKRMSVRDWMIFAEKFGIPFIIGKYGDNDSEISRKKLREAIEKLGTEGRATLGGEGTIEILNQALRSASGGGEHLHAGIVQLANSEISKAITSGTLTADTGGPGSFALGQVHADQKHKLSLADAMRIGRYMQRDIGAEYIRRNRIPDAAPPFLHIHVQKLSLLTDSQVVGNLVQAGMPLSIQQLREKFEYRAPVDEADTLKPLATKVANNVDPAGVSDPATSPS